MTHDELTAALLPLARLLAPLVRAELASCTAETRYYDGAHNPIGATRSFKAFCRKHGITLRRVGRRDVAVAADVDAAILSQAPRESIEADAFARATSPRRLRSVGCGR